MFLVAGNTVQDAGPILTGENLVHPKERIVDVKERYSNRLAVLILVRQLATEELGSKDRGEKGQEEHKEDQVQETADVAKDYHLKLC